MKYRITKNIFLGFFCVFFTYGFIYSWNGIIAEDGDLLTFTKWNELVAYIDNAVSWSGANLGTWEWVFAQTTASWQLQFKSIASGTWISVSSSPTEITVWLAWTAIGSLVSDTVSVANAACATTTVPTSGFINAYAEITTTTPGPERVPTGTIDPDAVSTFDANLIDNDYTNLTYNNSNAGTTNKSLPAIDLWASLSVWVVRIYWWTPGTYWVTDGTIQWSNNGTAWTDLVTWITKTAGATGDFDDYTVSGNYRYLRLFSVAWLNGSWVVISELEAFETGTTTTQDVHVFNRDVTIADDSGFIEVCSEEIGTVDVEVNGVQ